jgi:enoyl-CoA hydratase
MSSSDGYVELASSDGIATLTMVAAQRANALSEAMLNDLNQRLTQAWDLSPHALIIRALGSSFCGGFDLGGLDSRQDSELLSQFVKIEETLARIRSAPTATVAVIEGPAIGAGAELAAACDWRIGTPEARFRFPGVTFGVVLGTRRLVSLVGAANAWKILIGQATVDSSEAVRIGLLNQLVDPGEIGQALAELGNQIRALDVETLRMLMPIMRDQAHAPDPFASLVLSANRRDLAKRMRRLDGAKSAIKSRHH